MTRALCIFSGLLMLALAGCAGMPRGPELETVPALDLNRYLGLWYEIATIPANFQKDCVAVTAEYSLRPDGRIKVVNRCRKKTLDGPAAKAVGRAWVPDPKAPAKLKVSFFLWFAGDYWVIDLAPDYSYAVVGHPSRNYLWILSRQPAMDENLYAEILARLKQQGYDITRLKKTLQPGLDSSRKAGRAPAG